MAERARDSKWEREDEWEWYSTNTDDVEERKTYFKRLVLS